MKKTYYISCNDLKDPEKRRKGPIKKDGKYKTSKNSMKFARILLEIANNLEEEGEETDE